MIGVNDLIKEPILYNCSWEYKGEKCFVFLTKNKLYVYEFDKDEQGCCYDICSVKDIGRVGGNTRGLYNPSSVSDYLPVNVWLRHLNEWENVHFKMPCSKEGAKMAEELILALSNVVE